jgi:hypothetical protein
MRHDSGLQLLESFLGQEEQLRYLSFVKSVQKFRKIPMPARIDFAREICETYIIDKSSEQITSTFPSTTPEKTYASYVEARLDMFDAYEKWTFHHIDQFHFPKITQTNQYDELKLKMQTCFSGCENNVLVEYPPFPGNQESFVCFVLNFASSQQIEIDGSDC